MSVDAAPPGDAASRGLPAWAARPVAVLGLLALWLVATAWLRPLLLPDEARYAEVMREMAQRGLLDGALVPLLNGLPFFHKPPLTYWAGMLGIWLFGATELAARLGPLLGGWLMGAALWLGMRHWYGVRVAGIALAVLATSPFYFVGAQYANHDMLVAGTLTASVLCFARALEVADRGIARRWLLAGWAACALAVLAKGLIGIVLPALVIGPWLLAQRRWRDLVRLLHPAGLALFALLALPWFVRVQQHFPGFFDYFVVEQHFRRYATSGFNNRHRGWFFPVALLLLTLPWSGWLPVLLRRWRRAGAWPPLAGLWLWWLAAVLAFFSLPASKLVGYILPVLAPWSALLALGLARRPDAAWRATALAAALVCVTAVGVLALRSPHSARDIGRALAQQIAPGDRVVMVDAPFNDVAFYARLGTPPLVASDWADPDLPKRDNWRKELVDAARFAPQDAALLLPLAELPRLVCRGQRVWLVEYNAAAPRAAQVPGAQRVLQGRHAQLWRAEARRCSG